MAKRRNSVVREFYLENEFGQRFSLMDIEKGCLLTNPEGLGFSRTMEYEQVADDFVENINKLNQALIQAEVNFITYDNYKKFVNFVLAAKSLRLIYLVPSGQTTEEYFKDITISELTKTEIKQNGVMTETITMDSLGLWNKKSDIIYNISTGSNEVRWDFRFPSEFISYSNRQIIYENTGHKDASFLLEIPGYVLNPTLTIKQNGQTLNSISITNTIALGETLYYCTKPSDMYIYKIDSNNVKTNLFSTLNINNTNFFELPQGSCEIILTAENEINSAKLTIYQEYIGI